MKKFISDKLKQYTWDDYIVYLLIIGMFEAVSFGFRHSGVYQSLSLTIMLPVLSFIAYKALENSFFGFYVNPRNLNGEDEFNEVTRTSKFYSPVQRITFIIAFFLLICGTIILYYSAFYSSNLVGLSTIFEPAVINFISLVSAGFTVFSVGMSLLLMAENKRDTKIKALSDGFRQSQTNQQFSSMQTTLGEMAKSLKTVSESVTKSDEEIVELNKSMQKGNQNIQELSDKTGFLAEELKSSDEQILLKLRTLGDKRSNKRKRLGTRKK